MFIQQNSVQFADQVQLLQRGEKSSYLTCEQFEKILSKMRAPISRVEVRKLFHFICSGMKDPKNQSGLQRYLSIADLWTVIDPAYIRQSDTQDRSHDVVPTKQQPGEDMKRHATIESSNALTF